MTTKSKRPARTPISDIEDALLTALIYIKRAEEFNFKEKFDTKKLSTMKYLVKEAIAKTPQAYKEGVIQFII